MDKEKLQRNNEIQFQKNKVKDKKLRIVDKKLAAIKKNRKTHAEQISSSKSNKRY